MIQLRHVGIYVEDLEKEECFYQEVFNMHSISHKVIQADKLIDDLLDASEGQSSLLISKLITDKGIESREGDMIELLQVIGPQDKCGKKLGSIRTYMAGSIHLGLGIDNIEKTVDAVKNNGGRLITGIYEMSNVNKCCFCTDPENNMIVLIEKK